jgi:two-component system NtrC family sensor kinase
MQIKYVFLAFFVYNFASVDFLPNYNLAIYPFGFIPAFVYLVIIAYTIVKFKIMDIRIAITRASLFIIIYTLILGTPFLLGIYFKAFFLKTFNEYWWMMPLFIMALLATIGPFIYIFFQKRAEAKLLKEQRRYQDTLKHAAIGMTRIRNIRRLLSLIAHIVTKTVRLSFAAIYLVSPQDEKFTLQASRDKNKQPITEFPINSPLIDWLKNNKRPIILDELSKLALESNNPKQKLVVEDIKKLGGALIIPSFLEDELLGFIVLGDKLSGQMYTQDDLNVFQVLASQAALAIENAQFYEQAKEMQAQIAQAEKMATVGTMADGLSHQINNRVYALSLIAGDSIDTIKMTDTSNCTPEVQDMIKQINQALERIQNNVMQGGEVVKGILKYTRKGEEGIEALTMDQIIDGTLDMVQYKVKLHEIDLIRDYPKDLPKLRGNLVQMEEAFFNFIDNGYDAINERKMTLKEPGYKGQIKISAKAQGDMMQIVIKDNGMGVKNDDIKKIFTPFFTTKVSSRKGTGLGLYVIRSIITETHNGRISFDSTYKTGTTFTIHIPIFKT